MDNFRIDPLINVNVNKINFNFKNAHFNVALVIIKTLIVQIVKVIEV